MKENMSDFSIDQLTGAGYHCICGKTHEIKTEKILLESGALNKVYDIIQELNIGTRTLIVADINTWKAAGAELDRNLKSKGMTVKKCIFEDVNLHADERALCKVLIEFEPDMDFIIAVGAGTINDIVRFCSFKLGKPYIVAATAPSMDGYASSVSPLMIDGFKKTFSATFPTAIIGDIDVLREAPDEMIAAGMGDMLGKVTALADWKLGKVVNSEYYCPDIVGLVVKAVKRCIESLDGLVERDGRAVKSLTEGLILSGIAMQMTGNSRPASGAEHHISHYWEMQHLMRGETSPLHGNKVAAATILVSALYRKVLEMDRNSLEVYIKSEEEYAAWEQDVRKNYGSLAGDVITAGIGRKVENLLLDEKLKSLRENWDSLIGEIRDLLNLVPDMSRLLKKAGAPVVPGDIGIDFSATWSALRLAKEVRERYTVLQLADQLGVLNKYAGEIAEEYSRA